MKKGGKGGANTRTGLDFEEKTDLALFFKNQQPHYEVRGFEVFYDGQKVAEIYKKHKFYNVFLKNLGIDWEKIISKRLLPDNTIFVCSNKKLFIIECKHQNGAGSVDEKLQTCDFKKKQYTKLMAREGIEVEYVYLLDKWFKDNEKKYKDVFEYIRDVGCDYYFDLNELFKKFGLPIPPEGLL